MSVLIKNQLLDVIPKRESFETIPRANETYHTKFANQSDFTRWRPTFHLLAPQGWLNDPCGPGYDPSTGKYHLAFQWNPNGNDWGDISWGYATSYDMVSWKVSPKPCLSPSASYDCRGIFTGCFQPSNTNGQRDGTLTYVYTSVNHLPIHFTLPYIKGCETLSIAVSHDGGTTWKRKPCNPILPGPMQGLKVTGWRDPFIASSWPSASDRIWQSPTEEEVLYGFISGGLVDHTPTVFVYAVKKNDLTDWQYIGILSDTGLNFRPSRWSGDFGVNWEVANLVTLTDDEGVSRKFVIMGTEGCLPRDKSHFSHDNDLIARDNRVQRSQLWMCLKSNKSSPSSSASFSSSSPALMQYSFAGIFDSGLYYAANSFWDPISQQQIVFGWITEEDLPDTLRHRQGWSGLISLPRALKLKTLHRVMRARSTADLSDITSIELVPDGLGTYTVRTLGISPDRRLEKLRDKARKKTISDTGLQSLSDLTRGRKSLHFVPLNTQQWEVDVEIKVGNNCRRAGFAIFDGADKTVHFWDPISETFVVERPRIQEYRSDNAENEINHGPEVSPHTLFTYAAERQEHNDAVKSVEVEETLQIRAIFDVSVLEIFVNERTAISTRIYSTNNLREGYPNKHVCSGLGFFADGLDNDGIVGYEGDTKDDSPARLVRATVWDGLSLQ